MTIDSKEPSAILKGLTTVMKKEGFKRKSNNWYQNNDETILVVNLQSEYGNLKFINFAVWVKKLADAPYLLRLQKYKVNPELPRENHCHIRFRLYAVLPKDKFEVLRKLENINNVEFTDIEREKLITEFIEIYGMPLLKQCSTIGGIIKALNDNKFKAAFVHWKAAELVASTKL
jgi:hypothetical protein